MYKVTVVYVYHDCFLIEYEDLSIVFDFPEEYFSPEPIFSIVKDKIEGKRVLFLASHYHWDHFSPKIYELAVYAKEAHIVLSHDIVEVHKIPRENTTVVHPGKVVTVFGCKIRAFESSDVGVAYLLHLNRLNVYHSGDLSNWARDTLPSEVNENIMKIYYDALRELKCYTIDIAFINTVPGISNWTGAIDFVKEIRPKLVVPMHLRGQTEYIKDFIADLKKEGLVVNVFEYSKPGDTYVYVVESD